MSGTIELQNDVPNCSSRWAWFLAKPKVVAVGFCPIIAVDCRQTIK